VKGNGLDIEGRSGRSTVYFRDLTEVSGLALCRFGLSLSVGFGMSISLHAATQAIRLRRSGTSLADK